MRKKLTRHGNSLALVIDKPILELLGIARDTVLDISTDGKVLTIAPVKEGGVVKPREQTQISDRKLQRMLRRRRYNR
jgi:antitoxin component of MazEF toxin-antitoxin module